jgi:prevent-host-death family protein
MTQIMKATDVRSNWSKLINQVFRGETDVVVEKSGIPVAAIVSADDYQKLQKLKEQQRKDFALLKDIRAAFADQSEEQIEAGVSQSVRDAREDKRRTKTASPEV